MRPLSPVKLRQCVKDFLEGVAALPNWITSSASDRPDPGHYEWGNWSETMRSRHLWMLGGPWRTMMADIKKDGLISTIAEFHKLKDQMVWEIVEQTYFRAEKMRRSSASEDTVKTRIRSVFSWQRRHDARKHSLIWFIDFAFAAHAYSEFQGHMLFSDSSISSVNIENIVPELSPSDFGKQVVIMENQMFSHNFLPFYCCVPYLTKTEIITARQLANMFCDGLAPPIVDMDVDVRETRGMPREEKAIDFMTPWLQSMEGRQHESRWNTLVNMVMQRQPTISNLDAFKTELCRAVVSSLLFEVSRTKTPESGYVYDIAASTAVEQSERELLVSLRLPGQKRKKTVSRRTLRIDLDTRLQQLCSSLSSSTRASVDIGQTLHRGTSSSSRVTPRRNDR